MNDRERVLRLVRAAHDSLERSRRRIDDLNVYPVPDGDTGTNLALSARAVVEALESPGAEDRPTLVHATTRAALMGARGNSGVILSQIVRGAAGVLGEAEGIDATTVALALRSASDTAYRAVRRPVEGTMLTVIRELAEEAERLAADDPPPPELLNALVRHGELAVGRTPEQLDVLREAGVVDAGGAGLVELVRGLAAAVTGEELPPAAPVAELPPDAVHQELSRYRYCTAFVVEGDALDADELERRLEPLGDSLLVVGDPSALKVHVHTDDPGAALALGTRAGVVEGIEIANMHRQTEAREERLLHAVPDAAARADVVAVAAGAGNRRLFESLGARVVEGGQSMNPPASALVAAVEASPADEVILLPNNPNLVLAAEQAAGLVDKTAVVLPTDSIPAGLAAVVVFDPDRPADDNADAMRETLQGVATGAVTIASRDTRLNGRAISEGSYLGLFGGDAVAGGPDFDEVARAVIERLLAEPRDVLTFLTGAEEPSLDRLLEELRERHPDLELEVHDGGQPHYPLLLGAE